MFMKTGGGVSKGKSKEKGKRSKVKDKEEDERQLKLSIHSSLVMFCGNVYLTCITETKTRVAGVSMNIHVMKVDMGDYLFNSDPCLSFGRPSL